MLFRSEADYSQSFWAMCRSTEDIHIIYKLEGEKKSNKNKKQQQKTALQDVIFPPDSEFVTLVLLKLKFLF